MTASKGHAVLLSLLAASCSLVGNAAAFSPPLRSPESLATPSSGLLPSASASAARGGALPIHALPSGSHRGESDADEDTQPPPCASLPPSSSTPPPASVSPPRASVGPPLSKRRGARLQRDEAIRSRFATGDSLRHLREDVAALAENLVLSRATGDDVRASELEAAIIELEGRDAELVYARELDAIERAEVSIDDLDRRTFVVEQHRNEANMARACIPRFNLEGLWIGNYGNGAQLVNVTYAGDTLVATKVTGDEYIPRGETSFRADLAPPRAAGSGEGKGDGPIPPPPHPAARRASRSGGVSEAGWGSTKLQLYAGEGQVAQEGCVDKKPVDGQLVMFDDHFSFTWIPMKHTVFFSRPSSAVTLEMLRDTLSREDEISNMRSHVSRCFGLDGATELDLDSPPSALGEPFRRISRESDRPFTIVEEEGEVQPAPRLSFLRLDKLRGFIDGVL